VRLERRISLNAPLSLSGEGDEWEDWLFDPGPDPESLLVELGDHKQKMTALNQTLAELSARERTILESRFLTDEPKTLEELAAIFRVSRERIRQIEQRALQRRRTRICASLTGSTAIQATSP
jgi:RNA polymerase sigma-32 factor